METYELYKRIASEQFIQMFNKDWIIENAKDIGSGIIDFGSYVEVDFFRTSTLQSEEEVIKYAGTNYNTESRIVYQISKKDLSCKTVLNNFYLGDEEEKNTD